LWLAIALLAAALPVQAHGGPAGALSVARWQSGRAQVVRLNEGLALRRPEGYRFVCPILWGQDLLAPAESIPSGPVAIGSVTGLHLLDDDGAVQPHPDPSAAEGQVVALVRAAGSLFGLRYLAQGVDLLRIDAERVRVVWRGQESFQDLAAMGDQLALVQVEDTLVRTLRVSVAGEVIESADARIAQAAAVAWARPLGDTLHVVVVAPSLEAELGTIEDGVWQPILRGYDLAGPIELPNGRRVIGVDGALHALEDGEVRALEDDGEGLECLRLDDELSYACDEGDLLALEGDALGRTLFSLEDLVQPDLSRVPRALAGDRKSHSSKQ
jgi:hypothetical protein